MVRELTNFGNSIMNAQPGDVIILNTGVPYTYLYLGRCNGTATNPIIIKNAGGQALMTSGIALEDCSYIHIDAGISDYGIRITAPYGSGVPITVKGHCNNIEINGVELSGGTGGIWIKTELQDTHCDSTLLYPNRIDNIKVHHNYAHNIQGDVFYLGTTEPYGGTRPLNCNGQVTYPRPQGLSNFLIYNNRVENCTRTGIQLSGCDAGVNKIYNNTVSNCGTEYNDTQGAGIFIGGATRNCEVYNNTINNTWEHGIFSYGIGKTIIRNNVVNGSGIVGGKRRTYAIANILHNFIDKEQGIVKIKNNVCGENTDTENDYKVALFNSAGNGNSSQNAVSGNGKVYAQTGVIFKTAIQ